MTVLPFFTQQDVSDRHARSPRVAIAATYLFCPIRRGVESVAGEMKAHTDSDERNAPDLPAA